MTDAVWVSEAEVVACMDLQAAIDVLQAGLRSEAAGTAHNMTKTHLSWGRGSTLHAIGAVDEAANVIATKTWGHTPAGATPLLVLWDAQSSALLAIIEAFALGQLRTGAISGVATRTLAPVDAATMAIIGTGKQALSQVAAVGAVRDLERLFVYSPNPNSRADFCARARAAGFAFDVVDCATLSQATAAAAVITLVTRAREPFLVSECTPRGAHINAVGAITPERCEFAQDLFGRADILAVDSVSAARSLSAEFRDHLGGTEEAWSRVHRLSDLVTSGWSRSKETDLTIFKAMGAGLSDLTLGVHVLQWARKSSAGRPIPLPRRVLPQLTRR